MIQHLRLIRNRTDNHDQPSSKALNLLCVAFLTANAGPTASGIPQKVDPMLTMPTFLRPFCEQIGTQADDDPEDE
jgi:hypothetical protein